jgi:hypothetical protein
MSRWRRQQRKRARLRRAQLLSELFMEELLTNGVARLPGRLSLNFATTRFSFSFGEKKETEPCL